MTILELKDLFENSFATCVLYDRTFGDFFWEGQINEIPSELGIDNMSCSLHDAIYETRQKHNVDYEIFCDGICWAVTEKTVLYYIDDRAVPKNSFFDALKEETAKDAKIFFDKELNKQQPYVIKNESYQASEILENCNPKLYNSILDDCKKCLLNKNEHKLENNQHVEVNKRTFKIVFKRKEEK